MLTIENPGYSIIFFLLNTKFNILWIHFGKKTKNLTGLCPQGVRLNCTLPHCSEKSPKTYVFFYSTTYIFLLGFVSHMIVIFLCLGILSNRLAKKITSIRWLLRKFAFWKVAFGRFGGQNRPYMSWKCYSLIKHKKSLFSIKMCCLMFFC